MKMMTRAEKKGERGETERREGRKKGGETERQNTDMDPNTYALARTTFKITNGCLCRGPSRRFQGAPTTQNGLFWAGPVYFQRKNFSSENTTRVRSKGFKCRLPRIESTPTRCSTSRQKFNLAKPRATGAAEQRLAPPSQRHDPWRKNCKHVRDQKKKSKTVCARVGNHAKRVNVRCALWMMRAVFSLSDSGPRRLCVRSMSVSSLLQQAVM